MNGLGIILGSPKCATTSIYHYLNQHPKIDCPMPKEGHFLFNSLFPSPHAYVEPKFTPGKFNVDVGTDYAYHPEALTHLASEYPDAKVVLILRNPVDLAISLHAQRIKSGTEVAPLRMALEDPNHAAEQKKSGRPGLVGYLGAAKLEPVIKNCQKSLGKSLLILHYEDFKENQQAFLDKILVHFGVAKFEFYLARRHNKDVAVRSTGFAKFLENPPRILAPRYVMPKRIRNWLGLKLERANQKQRPGLAATGDREYIATLLADDEAAVAKIPRLVVE